MRFAKHPIKDSECFHSTKGSAKQGCPCPTSLFPAVASPSARRLFIGGVGGQSLPRHPGRGKVAPGKCPPQGPGQPHRFRKLELSSALPGRREIVVAACVVAATDHRSEFIGAHILSGNAARTGGHFAPSLTTPMSSFSALETGRYPGKSGSPHSGLCAVHCRHGQTVGSLPFNCSRLSGSARMIG